MIPKPLLLKHDFRRIGDAEESRRADIIGQPSRPPSLHTRADTFLWLEGPSIGSQVAAPRVDPTLRPQRRSASVRPGQICTAGVQAGGYNLTAYV